MVGSDADANGVGAGGCSESKESRGCSLHWIPGGHVTAFAWQKDYFVPHCVDAAEKAAAVWGKWASTQDK